MDTIWIYDSSDPCLKEKLMGKCFDAAIIDQRIFMKTDVKQHIISRINRASKPNNGMELTSAPQIIPCSHFKDGRKCWYEPKYVCGNNTCKMDLSERVNNIRVGA
jgi:hypothetical protein